MIDPKFLEQIEFEDNFLNFQKIKIHHRCIYLETLTRLKFKEREFSIKLNFPIVSSHITPGYEIDIDDKETRIFLSVMREEFANEYKRFSPPTLSKEFLELIYQKYIHCVNDDIKKFIEKNSQIISLEQTAYF